MARRTSLKRSRERESSPSIEATEDEESVCQILLDLRKMMSLLESLPGPNWVVRRKRSCLVAAPPLQGPIALPPQPTRRVENKIVEARALIRAEDPSEMEELAFAARTTPSPDTPLSFPRSDESDEKFKYSSKKTSKKRSKEEYLGMIEELTQTNTLLKRELEVVKRYYNRATTFHLKLQATKQEVLRSGLGKEVTADPTVQKPHCSSGPSTAHTHDNGLDLNLPVLEPLDQAQALADERSRSAEARKNRMKIMKTKSTKKG